MYLTQNRNKLSEQLNIVMRQALQFLFKLNTMFIRKLCVLYCTVYVQHQIKMMIALS